jgi:TP901 family phage tail tape measure protein
MALKDVGVKLVVEGQGKFKTSMGNVDRTIGGLRKNILKHSKAIGVGMTAIGASILGVGAVSIKMFADFEAGMREVASLVNLSKDQFNAMSKQVRELARTLGVDAVESTKALYQTISAGVPEGSALDFLEIATKAGIAGITDTATAVDGLTTVINAFKLPLEDTQKVADVMFQTVKLGKTTFGELSSGMAIVAPIAATLGLKFEDIAGAVATLTKQGAPTSVAMTQIRSALVALTKPTDGMVVLLNKMGVGTGEAALQTFGFAGTMARLSEAADNNNTVLAEAFGRVEGLNAVLGVTGQNAQTAADDLEAMQTATEGLGAATDALNEINKGTARQFALLKAQVKDIAIEIGKNLSGALNPVIDQVGKILARLGDWIKRNPELFLTIVKVTAAVGVLAAVLGPLLIILPSLAAGIALVNTAFWAMIANPVVLTIVGIVAAIGAVIAAVILLSRHWETLQTGMKKIWNNIASFLKDKINNVIDYLNGLIVGINAVLGLIGIRIPQIPRIDTLQERQQVREKQSRDRDERLAEEKEGVDIEALRAKRTRDREARLAEEKEGVDIEALRAKRTRDREARLAAEEEAKDIEALRVERTLDSLLDALRKGKITMDVFRVLSGEVVAPIPIGPSTGSVTNNNTFNVEANYTNPQDPASIALDLEALTLLAEN